MFTEYVTFRYDSSGESATDKPVGRTSSYTRRETRLAALNRQEQDSTAKDYKKVGALTVARKLERFHWSDLCGAENRGSPSTCIYFCNIPTRKGREAMEIYLDFMRMNSIKTSSYQVLAREKSRISGIKLSSLIVFLLFSDVRRSLACEREAQVQAAGQQARTGQDPFPAGESHPGKEKKKKLK